MINLMGKVCESKDSVFEVSSDEFNSLIVYAFRYTLGRRSYASHEVGCLVKKHLSALDKKTLVLILREIESARDLGDDCDKQMWLSLASSIKGMLN